MRSLPIAILAAFTLTACDQLNIQTPGQDKEPVSVETPPAETVELEETVEAEAETVAPPEAFRVELDLTKIRASEAVTSEATETGTLISGGNEGLSSGGRTAGAFINLGADIEDAVSGKQVAVTISTASETLPSDLYAAYSTADVGNSGWRHFELTETDSTVSFQYNVREKNAGNSDFLGFYAPTAPVTITGVTIEVVE